MKLGQHGQVTATGVRNRSVTGPAFVRDLDRWGASPALLTETGEVLSYTQLAERADGFTAGLPADIHLLALQADNTLPALIAYIGALRAGIPVLLTAGGKNAERIFSQCPPDAVYAPTAATADWQLSAAPIGWDSPPHPDLALLLSTSGSVGSPKMVRLSAANLDANARAIARYLGLTEQDRAVTSLPLSYSYGLSVLHSHLAVGASILVTERSVTDPDFGRLIAAHHVTGLAGVPSSYDLMETSGLLARLPASLRYLTQAGGRMDADMIRRVHAHAAAAGAKLFIMYGQTEATARIAYLPPDRLPEMAGCIGGPVPGGELWIESEAGERLPIGSTGELIYRGPNVMMGYATSRAELSLPPGDNILRTGDLAEEIEPGLFRIAGRKSRFVKPFGLRIGLDDLEVLFRAKGIAAHVAGDDELITIASLNASPAAAEAIAELKLPPSLFQFVRIDAVPTLPNGKTDYAAIQSLGRRRKAENTAGTDPLAAIEDFFARLKRDKPIQPQDSFESLGGDSLSYVQCAMLIEDALGQLPENWTQMSLADLRQAVQTGEPTSLARRNRLGVESDIFVRAAAILLVVLQHAIGGLAGGADVLMTLAGFSWARFQQRRLLDGQIGSAFYDFARRYLSVYAVIITGACLLSREIRWSHIFFISTFRGDWGGILNIYWFIETLSWCVLTVCLLFSLAPIRRLARQRPVAAAAGFVAIALAMRIGGALVLDAAAHAYRSPDQMLVYFAAGWALACGNRLLSLFAAALLVTLSAFAWGWMDTHPLSMAAACAAMILIGRISLPKILAHMVLTVAAASFYIYLFNVFPMYLTDEILDAQHGRFWALNVALSLSLGIGAWWVMGRLEAYRQKRAVMAR